MSIRSHAAALCADHIEFLMHRDEFKVIMTFPSLGRDILEAEIKAKERSREEQSELLRRREAEDGRLEEVKALKRLQENEEAIRKKLEEEKNLLAARIHDLEQKQKEWAQVAKRLFELTQGSIFGTTSAELTPSDQENDVQAQDLWAGLSPLVEKLAHGKSTLKRQLSSPKILS